MSTLIQLLDRPIAYNPILAKLKVGKVRAGPVAAVFLSQLFYWHNRMDGGWMYKTQVDIASETALTRDEQETARKRLIALGVLEEARRGVPATMHYRINVERLEVLLLETAQPAKKMAPQDKTRLRNLQNVETPQSGLVQSRKQECGDAANKNAGTAQTSMGDSPEQASGDPANFPTGDYTENTQEITQENKPPCPVAAQPDPEVVLTDNAIAVLRHLNAVTGKQFRAGKTSLENIRARLRDDYTVQQLMLAVDYKHVHWEDTEHYEYMQPTTLFRPSKFEGYLQNAMRWDSKGRPARKDWNKPTSQTSEYSQDSGVDIAERDLAWRRYHDLEKNNTPVSEVEIRVRVLADRDGLKAKGYGHGLAQFGWNNIWSAVAKHGVTA